MAKLLNVLDLINAQVFAPWDVVVSMTGPTTYDYVVIPSTVNQVAPTNWDFVGTGTTASPRYLRLDVSTTDGRVTGVSIASNTSLTVQAPPVLQALPPSNFSIQLGIIGTNGIFYKFVSPRPFSVSPVISFETDRVPPVPGLSVRIPWYTWNVTQPS